MVVLFNHEGYPYVLTKRIIAVGGENVQIDGNQTFLNFSLLEEPHAYYADGNNSNSSADVDSIIVDSGTFFVMGDNREVSRDSRHSEFGLVSIDDIVGKPLIILWSKDKKKIGYRFRRK
jgi:signal peptidase I